MASVTRNNNNNKKDDQRQQLAREKCETECNALLERLRSGEPQWSTKTLFNDKSSRFSKYKRFKVDKVARRNARQNDTENEGEYTKTDIEIVEEMFACESRRAGLLKCALTLLGKTRAQVMQLADERTIPYTRHCVFGSPDSTDIDVAFFVDTDEWGDLNNCVYDKPALLKALKAQGYDVSSRDCDVCVVVLDDNGDVKRTSKGSCYETQNIVYYTHQYHGDEESNPCPIHRPVDACEFDVRDKCRGVAKCFLDNLKILVGDDAYGALRSDRRLVYQTGGLEARALFIEKALPHVVCDWSSDHSLDAAKERQWRDALKSLAMKLAQMVLMVAPDQDSELPCLEYNKRLLPDRLREYSLDDKFDPEQLQYYLTRGKEGSLGDRTCLAELTREFVRIVRQNAIENAIEWKPLLCKSLIASERDTKNPLSPHYDDVFWRLFLETPNDPSDALVEHFISAHPQLETVRSLGPLFVFPSTTDGLLDDFVRDHVHSEPQRGDEWKALLSFYKCGRNTGVVALPDACITIQQYVRFYWNLIRGCLGEMIVQEILDPASVGLNNYQKAQVGLLVEEKHKKGSPGAAPDLLLVSSDGSDLIPVEIKCLTGPFADNGDRRRAVQTARKQLRTSANIIGQKGTRRGLLLILQTEQDKFSLYSSFCNV